MAEFQINFSPDNYISYISETPSPVLNNQDFSSNFELQEQLRPNEARTFLINGEIFNEPAIDPEHDFQDSTKANRALKQAQANWYASILERRRKETDEIAMLYFKNCYTGKKPKTILELFNSEGFQTSLDALLKDWNQYELTFNLDLSFKKKELKVDKEEKPIEASAEELALFSNLDLKNGEPGIIPIGINDFDIRKIEKNENPVQSLLKYFNELTSTKKKEHLNPFKLYEISRSRDESLGYLDSIAKAYREDINLLIREDEFLKNYLLLCELLKHLPASPTPPGFGFALQDGDENLLDLNQSINASDKFYLKNEMKFLDELASRMGININFFPTPSEPWQQDYNIIDAVDEMIEDDNFKFCAQQIFDEISESGKSQALKKIYQRYKALFLSLTPSCELEALEDCSRNKDLLFNLMKGIYKVSSQRSNLFQAGIELLCIFNNLMSELSIYDGDIDLLAKYSQALIDDSDPSPQPFAEISENKIFSPLFSSESNERRSKHVNSIMRELFTTDSVYNLLQNKASTLYYRLTEPVKLLKELNIDLVDFFREQNSSIDSLQNTISYVFDKIAKSDLKFSDKDKIDLADLLITLASVENRFQCKDNPYWSKNPVSLIVGINDDSKTLDKKLSYMATLEAISFKLADQGKILGDIRLYKTFLKIVQRREVNKLRHFIEHNPDIFPSNFNALRHDDFDAHLNDLKSHLESYESYDIDEQIKAAQILIAITKSQQALVN